MTSTASSWNIRGCWHYQAATRAEANARLARNPGIIASFSRALTEGLTVTQDDREFDAVLDETIGTIAEASRT